MNTAFVGCEFHLAYTRSSSFFVDVLQETFGETSVFAHEWRWIHLPRRKFWDLVVFWQDIPPRWEIDNLNARQILLVPMYDTCPRDEQFWKQYADCGILSFSRALTDLLRGWRLNVFSAQYFPPLPPTGADWATPGLRAFFWPRRQDLAWDHIRPLLDGATWSRVHVHLPRNLSDKPPTLGEKTPLTFSRWFESQGDFEALLRQHNVYFAPRRCEGIGLSFIEALSLGMAVVAPNGSTMNEYIRSGETGFLYDPEHPAPPPWRDAERWGAAARQLCAEGRQQWLRSVPLLKDFLAGSAHVRVVRSSDPLRRRATLKAWPGFLRYSTNQVLLKLRRRLLPGWKEGREDRLLARRVAGTGESP